MNTETDLVCFHCGLPVPKGTRITVHYAGEERPMCCHGCEAVANTIIDSGMDDFYRYRTANPEKPESPLPAFLQQLKAYDDPKIQQRFTATNEPATDNDDNEKNHKDIRQVSLILEGIVCAACVWLNENHLQALDGVESVSINYSNHRARVRWDNHRIRLSEILQAISQIGYMAHPYDPDNLQRVIEKERGQQLRRIGVAGILGMQVMILAVAMYSGEWWGINETIKQVFRWTSLALTLPVLLFASDVFLRAAWRDLKNRRVGMDVPVSLGILIAFAASSWHTLTGKGELYFDSVCMFTFFLLSARYFELVARKHSAEKTESLQQQRPAVASRIIPSGDDADRLETVPVTELQVGDRVQVKPGEIIPADGRIIEGTSGINESLLTGESLPVTRSPGDRVAGGSINVESPITLCVEKTGEDSLIASIQKLLENAQNNKPRLSRMADRVARWFIGIILLLAAAVSLYWLNHDPSQWLAITVATLVVTCPCALSLATPAAMTAANGQLAGIGLLPKNPQSLEILSGITDFVFDKTGTLTEGKLQLRDIHVFGEYPENRLTGIAASLEAGSEHPVAISLCRYAREAGIDTFKVVQARNTPGAGVEGTIDRQRWFIGSAASIRDRLPAGEQAVFDQRLDDIAPPPRQQPVFLADDGRLRAIFIFEDRLREASAPLVEALRHAGKGVYLMSGDNAETTRHIADTLGIEHWYANMKPQDKLEKIRELQAGGKRLAMTGDGINDAPVLAAADLSIAMGEGTRLAVASADMVLLGKQVSHIATGYTIARKCMRVIKQNLGWAVAYNLLAIPAAASGAIQPWMAALGMSISSLIVVLNALRLKPATTGYQP